MNVNDALHLSANGTATRLSANRWQPSRVVLREDRDTLAWYLRWTRTCWDGNGQPIPTQAAYEYGDWAPEDPKDAVTALAGLV